MRMRITWLFVLLGLFAHAQRPSISRYIPGTYLSDNVHRVELQNPAMKSLNLEGYLLVTRDYSVRFPASAKIGPNGSLRIAKSKAPGVQFLLSETQDFLVRFHFLEHQGHYVALFDPEGSLVEAVYMSQSKNVPFLPDRDTCITFDGKRIPFYLPPENRSDWQYVPLEGNRSNSYVKSKGKWQAAGAVLVSPPAVGYGDLILRYKGGIASVKWFAQYEQGCKSHIVERSEDQLTFTPVGDEKSVGDSKSGAWYSFYEKGLQEGQRYYYRIKGLDEQGNFFYSGTRELLAEEPKEEFSMEVVGNVNGELRVRFNSRYSQQVRIKLFDENLQEVALLFNDYVYADAPGLIVVNATLIEGKRYLVMATTDNGRFGQDFVLGK